MNGKGHTRVLVGEGSGESHCGVDDCGRECGMDVDGDARELDGVRHSYAQASGQSDGEELYLRCEYASQEQL
jgi:hypothetical protein